MKYWWFLCITMAWWFSSAQAQDTLSTPYQILKGNIERQDYHTYIERPFTLPPGVKRIKVLFIYNGKDQRTTIDLGIMDPSRFRGWSGGARNTFTISAEDATPGYLAGPLSEGTWKLILGVPNIRVGVVSSYEARIYIDTVSRITEFSDKPIASQAGWYKGDLHMHSGNSDGKCASQTGKEVPCPVYQVVETAVAKGLDFIALSDHNTTAQAEALRELQPAFDKILLVPAREITTFYGHANVFGLTDFIDFRVTDSNYAASKAWMSKVNQNGGIISINHPGIPSGEACMGCGWQIADIPPGVITSVEVLNGGTMKLSLDGPIEGFNLWHKMLVSGQHITAIGGSDDHKAATLGIPTTVIYMKELSVKGLLDGIRSGRVYIDVEGDKRRFLDLSAVVSADTAYMGDVLRVQPPDSVVLTAIVKGVAGGLVEFVVDGTVNASLSREIHSDDETIEVKTGTDAIKHAIYVKVRDASKKLVLVGNPIYIASPL